MKRSLITAAMLTVLLGTTGMVQAQGTPAPPPNPASRAAEPTAPHSADPTLPFQGPGSAETTPRLAAAGHLRLAADTGCQVGGAKETEAPGQNQATGAWPGQPRTRLPPTPTFC